MKRKYVSLNIKVFLLALVLMIIPSTIIGTLLYSKSIHIIQQKQKGIVKNALKNISDGIELDMKNVRDMSLFVISNNEIRKALKMKEVEKKSVVEYQNKIMSNLTFFIGQNSYINNLYIKGYNGFEVFMGENTSKLSEEDIKKADELKGGYFWKWKEKEGKYSLQLIREINNIDNPNIGLGTLEIEINDQAIKQKFHNFLDAFPGHLSLFCDDKYIYKYGEACLDEKQLADLLREKELENNFTEINRKNHELLYFYRIPNSQYLLISGIQFGDLYREMGSIKNLLLFGVFISFFLCLLIVLLFARKILNPLKQLTIKIQEISKENYKTQLSISSNDEIGILADSFNKMARRLDELVNEVIKGKMLQKEAQLRALQAQINPHFLYNNLDTAYWMSRLEKAEKTGKIILALSALYRSAVNTEGKMISVEMEKNYLEEYILIQQLRLDTLVNFKLNIENTTLKYRTLRFVLQPLVENSIEHGILVTGQKGIISISIYEEDESLIFKIEDSGKGEPIENLNEMLNSTNTNQKKGMALRNIHERIRLQYGVNYGLEFQNSELGGLCVIVKQPLIEHKTKQL